MNDLIKSRRERESAALEGETSAKMFFMKTDSSDLRNASCCCKGWSKLVLRCWTNSCAPREKVLVTLLKNSVLWTLFPLVYYCILRSFFFLADLKKFFNINLFILIITKCIIYLLFLLAWLHEYINSMRTGTSVLFLTVSQHLDQCLSQKSLKKHLWNIYTYLCM